MNETRATIGRDVGRILEALGGLLLGPLVITVVAVLGRSRLTESVAAAYLVVFIGYVLYSAVE